jgi:hypothetical protein
VRGFGYDTIGIMFPVRFGDSLNGLEGRCVESAANGKGFARFFTVAKVSRFFYEPMIQFSGIFGLAGFFS